MAQEIGASVFGPSQGDMADQIDQAAQVAGVKIATGIRPWATGPLSEAFFFSMVSMASSAAFRSPFYNGSSVFRFIFALAISYLKRGSLT